MIDISFDTSELVEQADRITMLDDTTLAEMRLDAVNVVSLTVRKKSIDQTHAELNLSRDYIEARIARAEAKGATARARITSEVRGATLQRFGAQQEVAPVNWSNSRIAALGHKFGKWPGWTYRKGDASRGIDEDDKATASSAAARDGGSDFPRLSARRRMPLQAV